MNASVCLRRIALLSALIAAIAFCFFDPADPWKHPTWFMTMGLLGTWVGGILSLMFSLARKPVLE
jgi:hypothetical protein